MSAVTFAETMNAKGLSIDQEKFDELLNEALQAHEPLPEPVMASSQPTTRRPPPPPEAGVALPQHGRLPSQSGVLNVEDGDLSEVRDATLQSIFSCPNLKLVRGVFPL